MLKRQFKPLMMDVFVPVDRLRLTPRSVKAG